MQQFLISTIKYGSFVDVDKEVICIPKKIGQIVHNYICQVQGTFTVC